MHVLLQFGLRDLEVAKPFAKDTVARTRPLLPIWARDAPWSWWAGGWSIALILAASLRPRKASLKAAPQPAAKPSSPNVRSSSAAPPETPLADATSSPWVPLDFSPEGVKPTKKHNGKENTASTSNKPNESNEKKSEEAQLPVEASTEDSVGILFLFRSNTWSILYRLSLIYLSNIGLGVIIIDHLQKF